MHKFKIIAVLLIITWGCGTSEDQPNLEGTWEAVWKTDPASFQDVPSIDSFEMNGKFIFEGQNLTVVAMGYPGCVFGEDTISHTQKWELKGDTLNLISKPGVYGISYSIDKKSDSEMVLNLVEDISVTLTKKEI